MLFLQDLVLKRLLTQLLLRLRPPALRLRQYLMQDLKLTLQLLPHLLLILQLLRLQHLYLLQHLHLLALLHLRILIR